jgi:hypothetical protein
MKNLEQGTSESTFDTTNPSEEFKSIKENVDFVDSYSWIEGWKHHELATQYQNEFIKFKSSYQIWIDIHYKIFNSKRPISEVEWKERERQAGIYPA